LNIGGQKEDEGGRWFIIEKDLKNNILYVAHGDESRLYSGSCIVSHFNFIPEKPNENSFECTAKFRYRQSEQKVFVEIITPTDLKITFAERQRAITEGQFAVLYKDNMCLGGGVIEKAIF
jgi:tRNA-specific 2-thiouridylase